MREKKKIILRVVLTSLTVILICWIFSNSMQNAEDSSSKSAAVREFLQNFIDMLFPGGNISVSEHFVRKAAHFSEYALLGAMLLFTYRSYTVKRFWFLIPALIAALVPFLDEGLQFFFDGRTPKFTDVCIDLAGTAVGMLFAWAVFYVVNAIARKRKRRNDTEIYK